MRTCRSILRLAVPAAVALGVAGCQNLPPAPPSPPAAQAAEVHSAAAADGVAATNLATGTPATNAPTKAPPVTDTTTNRPAASLPVSGSSSNLVEGENEAYEQILLLARTLMIVRTSYVDESKTSYKDLVHAALAGMVQSLDPYSQFMEPTGYKSLKEETQGEFGGVGIVLGTKDGTLSVIAPMEDTPAFRAGILAGDKIIEINGEKTDGFVIPDAVKRLRGEPGSRVTLKVLRNNKDVKEVTLARDVIKVTSVKGARVLDGGIGYVRITQFSDPTAAALDEALAAFARQNIRALVLDLRNNPGGLLSSAIQVSQLFLKKGTLIVSTRARDGRPAGPPATAMGTVHYTDIPLAVLINGGSASASEIVAGALKDNKRAVLVGETSFGKGSVQSVLQIDDANALRLTTARYYTPSGRSIHEKGIEPDVAVPITPDEWVDVMLKRNYDVNPTFYTDKEKPAHYDTTVDRQLERAVDLLKGLLIFEASR